MKILIGCKHNFASRLKRYLTKHIKTVDVNSDGNSVALVALNTTYDFIFISCELSGKDGLTILKKLRQEKCYTPVIMLSTDDSIEKEIACLEAGADSFVRISSVKTDDLTVKFELLYHKMMAILKRHAYVPQKILTHRDIVLDPNTYEVTIRGKIIYFQRAQYKALKYLIVNRDRVIGRNELFDEISNNVNLATTNSVDVMIHHLRQILGAGYIRTVRSVGYQLI